MCGLYAYNQCKENSTCATDFHGVWPLPRYSNVIPHISLFVTNKVIVAWINTLAKNNLWRFWAYHDKIKEMFHNIHKEVKPQLLKTSRENIKLY